QEVDNAILFDLVGFSGYLQDTGTSSSHGIELDWDVPIDDNWSLIGNATWNDTETPEGEQRIRRPEFFGNIGVLYRGFDERLRVLGNVRSAQDSVDEIFGVGRVDLDNYAVFDLSVSYDVRDFLTAYARVVNAFDEDYQEVVDFDNGGSAAYAGIRLTF
ncbi:MAG: TonB-dependent receptor, partial [Pseudomonadota bacterium]